MSNTIHTHTCILISDYNSPVIFADFLRNLQQEKNLPHHFICITSELASNQEDRTRINSILNTNKNIFVYTCSHHTFFAFLQKIATDNSWQIPCTHIIHIPKIYNDSSLYVCSLLQRVRKGTHSIMLPAFANKHMAQSIQKRTVLQKCTAGLATFCIRVNTGKVIQNSTDLPCLYPISILQWLKISAQSSIFTQAFTLETMVRALWAGFPVDEVPIIFSKASQNLPSMHAQKAANKVHFSKQYTRLVQCFLTAVRLVMRALIPLPFKRHDSTVQEKITLRHPLQALKSLMQDPHNRATPQELAKTAGISMAILTIPAPIIQSVFLLLCIGWLRLNRLCAIAMIPLTWPPFLPGAAILVGYRFRHGTWLTEFSLQTLGYEVGERFIEWVIGSLILTPILGCLLAGIVGMLAYIVHKQQ